MSLQIDSAFQSFPWLHGTLKPAGQSRVHKPGSRIVPIKALRPKELRHFLHIYEQVWQNSVLNKASKFSRLS
jgi:hypothetical protein